MIALACVVTHSASASDFPIFAGLNIPWNHYAHDIGGGSFDPSWFEHYFIMARRGSQNVARLWVHCNGAPAGLSYKPDGTIQGLSKTFNRDLRQLLDIAQKHSIVVQLCLWSFDMCNAGRTNLINNMAASWSYVQNALVPMLTAVKDFPNVIVEAINEPEWCIQNIGSTKSKVNAGAMQRFVGMIAEAAHAHGRKVTVGSASLQWSSYAPEADASLWDDSSLQTAYRSENAYMDFYNIHYYDWMHQRSDPMRASVWHWQLDRPTVIAEIPPNSRFYSVQQMLDTSTSNGFKGAIFWAYNDHKFNVEPTIAPLATFARDHSATYDAVLRYLKSSTPMPPTCKDEPPSQDYTCAQQKGWGKCDTRAYPWMIGNCCKTCFNCAAGCGATPYLHEVSNGTRVIV